MIAEWMQAAVEKAIRIEHLELTLAHYEQEGLADDPNSEAAEHYLDILDELCVLYGLIPTPHAEPPAATVLH